MVEVQARAERFTVQRLPHPEQLIRNAFYGCKLEVSSSCVCRNTRSSHGRGICCGIPGGGGGIFAVKPGTGCIPLFGISGAPVHGPLLSEDASPNAETPFEGQFAL